MLTHLIPFAKIFLVFSIWLVIAFIALFLLKSWEIYYSLKKYEQFCTAKRKEVIRSFIPLMTSLSRQNNILQMAIGIKKTTPKDFLFLSVPLFLNSTSFLVGVKSGYNLIKKLLRNQG